MHIQVTRPFWYAGAVVPVGTVLALPTVLAAELVHNNKATPCAAPAAEQASTQASTAAATPAAPASKVKAAPKATPPKPPEATP